MYALLICIIAALITAACGNSPGNDTTVLVASASQTITRDTLVIAEPVDKPYSELEYKKKEVLNAASGTKSVVFNSKGSKLYAMNLEGMSVYEFDQSSRKITREF